MTDRDQDLPKGMRAVAQHARELSHAPVHERMERLGRERLVLNALHARPRVKLELRWAELLGLRRFAGAGFAGAGIATLTMGIAIAGFVVWQRATEPKPLAAVSGPIAAETPLTYSSYGGQPSAANYLVAPTPRTGQPVAQELAGLRFSDGSEIKACAGARLRVDSTQSRGARVFLEQGTTRTHVEHGERSNWVFVAGPFDVHVTGTTFNLAWEASTQTVDLELIEGSVSVTSPLGPSQIEVKTGQRFRASARLGTMQLESADAPQPAGIGDTGDEAREQDQTDKAEQAESQPNQPLRAAARGRSHHSARSHVHPSRRGKLQGRDGAAQLPAAEAAERQAQASEQGADQADPSAAGSFSDLMRAGAFARVIELATAAGLSQTLERGSADDVRALADAARYLHRTDLAVRSLTVLRTRFPGAHQGTAAAFLLGRTYENAAMQSDARRFYELYLRETPSGEFAAEALAGRMRMVAALSGPELAQPIAQEYLKRFPRGVHAAAAKRFVRADAP
jgi:hypothetical protein